MQIRELATKYDPYKLFEWPPILQTINIGPNPPYLAYEIQALARSNYDNLIYDFLLKNRQTLENGILKQCVANLVHQSYHLSVWERLTGQSVDDVATVFEVGGGIGFMRLLWHLINPGGGYTVYDFSELLILQQFMEEWLAEGCKTLQFERMEEESIGDCGDCDLFIANWSLSEIPDLDERQEIVNSINSKSYLFSFQSKHEIVDNVKWFAQFAAKMSNYEWKGETMEHNGNSTNFYMVGVRK